jgi:flagellar biosynthesis GTPase FlhF
VSFVTTGQEVPDEIELARGERLAEGMLNGGWA